MSINVKEYTDDVYIIDNEFAYVWCIKVPEDDEISYCYGGTRTVPPEASEESVYKKLRYLGTYESGLKNHLINDMISEGVFEPLKDKLPDGFAESCVKGGRCIIQPKTQEYLKIINDVEHKAHEALLDSVFSDLGKFLDSLGGKLKLTPDFGRYAGLADFLHKHTENVLGIDCAAGGCGGKASYTSTGIIQAAETMGAEKDKPLTIIGSAGACGTGVLEYFTEKGYTNIAVCDLVYDNTESGVKAAAELELKGVRVLKSDSTKFTSECLGRGGIIIASTVGGEFLNSDTDVLKDGTVLLLAHNECISADEEDYVKTDAVIKNRDITVVPGQLLTFGGALTSRIEWFYRQSRKGEYFCKPLAHEAVRLAADSLMKKYVVGRQEENLFRIVFGLV